MVALAAAIFGAFAAIIAVGWYTFLGWMWIWTLWLPLLRPVGGALAVICTALTVYGLSKLAGEVVDRLRVGQR
ncbi:hypothetical protein [Pseudoxanthomonas mexicana]|uniref:hypothetical protein n=1 Tax=Pseudoxanthomonas mexicana TaxID=128785 RepID=UPI0028A6ECF9|nr:hypothetical protein [Pseudoxanthomonas mexicana]